MVIRNISGSIVGGCLGPIYSVPPWLEVTRVIPPWKGLAVGPGQALILGRLIGSNWIGWRAWVSFPRRVLNDSSPVPHLEKAGKCTTYYVHARMYISLSEASGLNRFLGSPVAPVGDGARFEKPVIVQGISSRTWTLPCQSA